MNQRSGRNTLLAIVVLAGVSCFFCGAGVLAWKVVTNWATIIDSPPAIVIADDEDPPPPTPPPPAAVAEPEPAAPEEHGSFDFEAQVTRQCENDGTIFPEPQGFELAHVFRQLQLMALPAGTALPAPRKVMGLDIMPRRLDGTGSVACVDTDPSVIDELAASYEGPTEAKITKLGSGAWLVTSPPNIERTAASALVSANYLKQFRTKGPLVALVRTDNIVAFADARDRSAVRRAAAAIVELDMDPSFTTAQPLIFQRGAWTAWTAPESREMSTFAKLGDEHLTSSALDIVQLMRNLVNDEHWRALGLAFPLELNSAYLDTARQVSSDGSSTVRVWSQTQGTQIVGRSTEVVLLGPSTESAPMPWREFVELAGDSLTPLTLNRKPVPNVFVLQPLE